MSGKKILIVDDDVVMRNLVGHVVERSGNEIYLADNGAEGINQFHEHQPDLVILDLMMPQMTGWEVCQHIRQSSNVPIIMLSSISQERDIVRGFDIGADEFVTKPFNPNLLQARVQAVLRRNNESTQQADPPTIYSDDYLTIDLSQRRMLVAGKLVKLTATEHSLLAYLMRYTGEVLPFHKILENVWGAEYRENTDYVHVYIWHLRKKIEENHKSPKYILTEHGVGYRFEQAKLQPLPAAEPQVLAAA
jgi:two-component system KDP operon response regulator KdpE